MDKVFCIGRLFEYIIISTTWLDSINIVIIYSDLCLSMKLNLHVDGYTGVNRKK